MEYTFRTTYKQNADTYIEDRGTPYPVRRGDELFGVLDAEFGALLRDGQTALRGEGGSWDVADGFPLFEEARREKLKALHKAWLEAEASGTVLVDGWAVDANERANRDVAGLIVSMEASEEESTTFCGADNTFRLLSLSQLRAVQLAIIAHAQALYARKWEIRTAIGQAGTFEELDAVVISFDGI